MQVNLTYWVLYLTGLDNYISHKRQCYTQKHVRYFTYSIFKFSLRVSRISNKTWSCFSKLGATMILDLVCMFIKHIGQFSTVSFQSLWHRESSSYFRFGVFDADWMFYFFSISYSNPKFWVEGRAELHLFFLCVFLYFLVKKSLQEDALPT